MPTKTLKNLFIHSLSDIYSAEKQMTKSLPRMARAATNPGLRSAFETHLEETQGQIERIDQVVEASGIKLQTCQVRRHGRTGRRRPGAD
ncbi:ferritin-like metal-binding protein YciE [Paraburkholderia sp. MM6662-R1]